MILDSILSIIVHSAGILAWIWLSRSFGDLSYLLPIPLTIVQCLFDVLGFFAGPDDYWLDTSKSWVSTILLATVAVICVWHSHVFLMMVSLVFLFQELKYSISGTEASISLGREMEKLMNMEETDND